MRERGMRLGLLAVVAALALSCDAAPSPTSPASGERPADRLHAQALAALDRWAAAKGSGGEVAIVGELTGQLGDWELPVGENNKLALMAGFVRAATDLPSATPPPGAVRWPDGTSATVPLLSAVEAAAAIATVPAGQTCESCRALELTSARLADGPVDTARGPAIVPVWQFTVQRSRVIVTRVALAHPVVAQPPPWDPMEAPEGISIQHAVGRPLEASLTVSFVGAPGPASEPCGADYTAEAVESDLAIVVIVVEHRNPAPAACRLVGAERSAVVQLANPLGQRAVLEVKEGLPVTVTPS
ncbi:MAG TPA: hypothetical protein VFJ71_03750 [Candidatus Limnocylindrales bacterium]|nr:hypothetical protein [Candidatus Limnocylindrales bacterium]